MGMACRQLMWRGLLLLLMLSLSAAGAFAGEDRDDFTWNYWGTAENDIHVYGDTLALPELELSGESISFDGIIFEEDEDSGSGIYFYGDLEQPEVTAASVVLDSSSNLDVSLTLADSYVGLTGIDLGRFVDAHVSLLGQSTVNVGAQGTDAYSKGINLYAVSGLKTAQVVIDEGSALTVKATAIGSDPEMDASAYAEAGGIDLRDDAHVVVNVDNGSTIDVESYASADGGDSSSARAYSYGIEAGYSDLVEIVMAGGSSLNVRATADTEDVVDGYTSATSVGIVGYGETVTIALSEGSMVDVEAMSVDEAEATGIDANYQDGEFEEVSINHGEVTLDSESTVVVKAEATGSDGDADAIGVDISAEGVNTARLTLADGSSVSSEAIAVESYSVAGLISNSPHGVVTVTSGSSLSASATASDDSVAGSDGGEAVAVAGAVSLGLLDVAEVEITLTDATLTSVMSATATQVAAAEEDEGGARAIIGANGPAGGFGALGFDSANISLQGTTVSVDALATASAVVGESVAEVGNMDDGVVGIAGIAMNYGDNAQLVLDHSTVDVVAKAVAGDEASVFATGINLMYIHCDDPESAPLLQLTDSTVSVNSTATVTNAEGDSSAFSVGILSYNTGVATFNLDHSTVTAVGKANMVSSIGLYVGSDDVVINLTNGSSVSTVFNCAEGLDVALLVVADNSAEINIDATSSISGTWAAMDLGGNATLNNAGTIAGRVDVFTLNNASTGILQATFGAADTERDEEDGVRYFSAFDSEGDYGEYYFAASTANLDDGTTFRIVPTDDLGLEIEGDFQVYALLDPPEPSNWNQDQLNLTTTSESSLLGMSWDESSDSAHLNVKFTYLSPEVAGLSDNGTAAYEAAVDAGAFTFASDPDEWTPNVSGAFVAGMTQSLGTSYFNIGNRMGALMGMNSGDEVVASNGMWFSIRFTEAEQDKRDSVAGFDSDSTGLSIGIDREFGDTVLGFAYTRGTTDADANDNSADFDMTDNLFSLYGSYDAGAWYSEAILSAGFGSVDGERHVGSDVYASDYDSNSYNAKVEMGMKLNQQGWQINPLFALQYSVKEYDSYTETGSGDLALSVKSQEYSTFTAGLGAAIQKEFQRNWGTFTPEFRGTVNYDIENDRIVSTANFVGGSTSFVAKGVEPSETSWDLGAALTVASLGEENVSFRVGYDYSGREDFEAHSFTGKIRFEF